MNLSLPPPNPAREYKNRISSRNVVDKKTKPMDNVQNMSQAYCVQQAALLHFMEVYTTGIHCLAVLGPYATHGQQAYFFPKRNCDGFALKTRSFHTLTTLQ
jgi:hypothetical protein